MKANDTRRDPRQSMLPASSFNRILRRTPPEELGQEREKYSFPLRHLLQEAEEALGCPLESIVEKKHTPPSGDLRDYFSLSIYFWPDPQAKDGLPYVPKDGQVNPEVNDYDGPRFIRMFAAVDTLSLAYAFTKDERFAARASEWLRIWFINKETRMNPNMLFAQHIPGENVVLPWKDYPARYVPGTEGRKGVFVSFGGVIEDLPLAPLTDCIRMLRGSAHWSTDDDSTLREWYRAYVQWVLTHQHGLDEAACRNNHGSWYWSEVICFLNFDEQYDRARAFAEKVLPERLRLQIEPDGSQPEELQRAISLSYCAFTLASFANFAVEAKKCNYDALSLETEDGRSICKGVDWLLPYLIDEKEWTWKQIKPFNSEAMAGVLAAVAEGTGDPKYTMALKRLPVASGSRCHLLYDL